MKKIVYYAVIACLLTTAISCKSTKAGKKAAEESPENSAPVEAAESSEAGENAEAGEKAAVKPAAAVAAESEEQDANYTGWIKASKKNITERFGKVQLKIKSGIGSFTIAALNEKEKAVPVLSTANEYITNAFYLKTSKKVYNLVTDSGIRSSAKRTTDGAVINYDIPSVAQLSVGFSCFASDKKKDIDMVKVTVTVKNTSQRNDDYSIKAVLDTVLGEAAAYHFYTYDDVPVKNEVLYRTLQNQKWFVSKNVNAAMQLFFTGADCTTPELVALANYSTLEKNSWEPDMLSYRVFDTVLSYNNSAVCAVWKPLKLAPSESGKVVFYIAVSGDGKPANGEKYVYSKEYKDAAAETKTAAAPGPTIITSYTTEEIPDTPAIVEGVTEIAEEADNTPQTPSEIPSVDFYIKNMSKEQLSPEYIQALLDRIASLEEDSSSLNRQELLQLNAELDAILTYLRQ